MAAQGANGPASTPDIPHLQKHGTATQLVVDGKPYLALAGELLNNSATSVEYMKPLWPKLAKAGFNTILAGVSWAQIEPAEGKFDFTVLDGIIRDARQANLRLALLWFGTWKNGLSSYPPDWVKKDYERFPRVQIVGDKTPWPVFGGSRTNFTGSLSIELFSTFGDTTRDADARAFAALMRHVKQVDGDKHTVLMIQVENEMGLQGDTRDRSPAANTAFDGPVPADLMDYLQRHKSALIPELNKVWEAAGFKTSGTWNQVFGKGRAAEEIFMAWNFARYVNRVIEAGKAEYPIPMFLNCPQFGFGTAPAPLKGGGQSGGAMPDAMDVYRAGAPAVDWFAADIYSTDYTGFCAKYSQSGNPLFIAETGGGADLKTKAIYAFGHHDAMGFSPFGIDRMADNNPDPVGYALLSQLAPMILEHQGDGTMSAVLMNANDPVKNVPVGNYTLEVAPTRPRGARGGAAAAAAPAQAVPSVAIFIATGSDEYFIAGNGVSITFASNTPGAPLAGLGVVEEGKFVNGRWVPGRWLAGDDTEEGDYLILRDMGIFRVTVYHYR
jgi:hypothetical protein